MCGNAEIFGVFLDFPVHHSKRVKKTVGKAIDQEFQWLFKQHTDLYVLLEAQRCCYLL